MCIRDSFKVMVESALVVVDEHACGNVHGIDEYKPLPHAALIHCLLNLRSNIDNAPAPGKIDMQFFSVTFHNSSS